MSFGLVVEIIRTAVIFVFTFVILRTIDFENLLRPGYQHLGVFVYFLVSLAVALFLNREIKELLKSFS